MQRKVTLRNSISVSFITHLRDPRAPNRSHPLDAVIFCVLIGVLCGANGFVAAEVLAQNKRRFIERYVALPHGIPGHDTMARVFALLDTEQFAESFAFFVSRMTGDHVGDVINIDGKTIRGALSAMGRVENTREDQLHLVSAFSNLRGYVLGQLRSKAVANEIAAAQDLLRLLNIRGAIVTLDAAHNSFKTLAMIVERGAHFIVGVKANNGSLLKAAKKAFNGTESTIDETETAHGRVARRCYTIAPADDDYVRKKAPMVRSFIRTERHAIKKVGRIGKPRVTYYASSLDPFEARRAADAIRLRWGIENKLHWVLDVTFDDDGRQVRIKAASENFARMTHVALNLLRADTTKKLSIANKRLSAASSDEYLEALIGPPPAA
jgi:predicted transposase YbfD/YdcC